MVIQYVENGGHVYLAGGTGEFRDASEEAAAWNTFLNHFGLGFEGAAYNGIGGTLPIRSSHPIFVGVRSLYQDNGNDISTLDPTHPCQVLVSSGGHGLYAACSGFPPDPATVAPPLNPSVVTDLATATAFLYTGTNPIQTGVAPGTIESYRVVVLRGRVLTRDGEPLPGATLTTLQHPEFGQTVSREDGQFDMAVNGGAITVHYARDGYLPVQRQVQTPWRDYIWLPDVVMIPLDEQVTTIDLSANQAIQVAQGSAVSDEDGTRQATLLFAQGTEAELVLPDGSTQAISALNVRATEYTVGDTGPEAMPGELPPNSGYTYAVEFSVDEALAAGAVDVRFNQPVINYLENFLDLPVGGIVPVGYYDRLEGRWVPSDNGLIIQILRINDNGLAVLDVDGSGQAASAQALADLGITNAERRRLAQLYAPGQSLWRVAITHFTPWDCNWPYGPPDDAEPPNPEPPQGGDDPDPNTCEENASIIECQNQVLGDRVKIVGTPFTLNYRSNRVPGRLAGRMLNVKLSRDTVPASLARIELEIQVAGQRVIESFPPLPNQSYQFSWDGRDAYGRLLQGQQRAVVRIGYTYGAVYLQPAAFSQAFGRFSGSGTAITRNEARSGITLWQQWETSLGLGLAWDAGGQGFGAWTLSIHHSYDPENQQLFLGDGSQRSQVTSGLQWIIDTAAGTGTPGFGGDGGPATQAQFWPHDVAVTTSGEIYIAAQHRVRKIDVDGIITTVAGEGNSLEDGIPAIEANILNDPNVAVGPDNSVYLRDGNRIRRINADGTIVTVAGMIEGGFSGDGGPATEAKLWPHGIAIGTDSSIYIADIGNRRVRHVGPDGIISTIVGDGETCMDVADQPCGDGGPAIEAQLNTPYDVAIGPGGILYIADIGGHRVRAVTPDGIIRTIAGRGFRGLPENSGEGIPATEVFLSEPRGLAVGSDGSVYVTGSHNRAGALPKWVLGRIRPDGIFQIVVGGRGDGLTGGGFGGDGGPAGAGILNRPKGIDVAPDHSIYIADEGNYRIRRVAPQISGSLLDTLIVAAEDGGELYVFDILGRHLRTLHGLIHAELYSFSYDTEGRLTAVEDGDGNVTAIERDGQGNPTAIVAPFGQRTTLSVDTNGYLASITNPAGETHAFTYHDAGGLLATYTDPRGNIARMSYDDLGRLVRDEMPDDGFWALARVERSNGYSVTLTSAEGRATVYQIEETPAGHQQRLTAFPNGLQTDMQLHTDGGITGIYPDGTNTAWKQGPDPRWGMQAPLPESVAFTTPGGLSYQQTFQRTVTLADGNNLLSLETLTDTVTINGRTYMSVYDASARIELLTTPAGRETRTTLDEQGRITRLRIGNLEPVQFAYDARGRLVQTRRGSGGGSRTVTFGYNDESNIAQITDPLGQEAEFDYDLGGRVTQITLPGGHVVQFGYDANGNLTSITPPGKPNHAFTYTDGNLLAEYIPPDIGANAGRLRYQYNADRQLTRINQSGGTTVNFGYDDAGRLMTVAFPRGQISYSYDPTTGKLATLTAPDGPKLTFSYDGDLPTGTTWSGTIAGSVDQTYNNDFQIASQSVNGTQTIAFQYDADGLLVQAGNLTLERGPQHGLVTGSTLDNVSDAVAYNSFGEVNSYQAAVDSADILTIQFTRDALGRITEKTETLDGNTNTFRYSYDPSGRLVEVRQNGNIIASYTYDGNGNRLSHTSAAGTVNGVYDDQDRLLQYSNATYTYTANGELLAKSANGQTTTYDYDTLGNLIAVALPDGTQIEYIADGYNRRVGKRVNGTLVQGFFYQDDLNPIAELDGNNNVVSRFIYAGEDNVPAYMVRSGETYRILTDYLGSPRLVVHAASGAIAQRMDYDAFGNVLLDTNPGFQPFGFAGGLYDRDTGLTRFDARDYDAEIGRWTAKDPIGFASGDMNLYTYVGNDAVNLIDPTGTGAIGNFIRAVGVALGILFGGDEIGTGTPIGDRPDPNRPTQPPSKPAPGGGSGGGGGGRGGGRGGGGRGGGAGCIILFLNFNFCAINPEEPVCLRQQGYPPGYGPGA